MAETSLIEWTDATWNPITGCSVVSPGCTHCYAMKLAGTRMKHHWSRQGLTTDSKAGPVWNGQLRFNEDWLNQPLRWTRPRRIFVCAHGDLFHEAAPDAWIDQVFAVILLTPHHTYQILTKRAARMQGYLADTGLAERLRRLILTGFPAIDGHPKVFDYVDGVTLPIAHAWIGVSVEDQNRADERRSPLAALAAESWTTFVSYEPALGPVDWTGWDFLKWFIGGGESGIDSRPSHGDWHRAARDYCAPRGIPYFFKQWGDWKPDDDTPSEVAESLEIDGRYARLGQQDFERVGKKAAGRRLDGVEHNAMPGGRP